MEICDARWLKKNPGEEKMTLFFADVETLTSMLQMGSMAAFT
jgi:hypothetical protein